MSETSGVGDLPAIWGPAGIEDKNGVERLHKEGKTSGGCMHLGFLQGNVPEQPVWDMAGSQDVIQGWNTQCGFFKAPWL